MKAKPKSKLENDMLPEYDFTGAVRGKYYERYRQGTNVVLLAPDVAEVFRDAAAVNDALRLLVSVAEAKVPILYEGAGTKQRPKSLRKRLAGQRRSGKAAHR